VPLSLYKVCTLPRREENVLKGINKRVDGQGVRNLQMNSPRCEASENAAVSLDVASGLPDCKWTKEVDTSAIERRLIWGQSFGR